MNKILNTLINIFIIGGLIFICFDIMSDIYKNITITNKIENPSVYIEINGEYYCRVTEKQEKTKSIEV